MLALVRNTNPYTAALLLLYAFICRIPALIAPQGFSPAGANHHVYNALASVIKGFALGSTFLLTLLCVVSTFAQALFLNHISLQSKLYTRSGYVVAFVFLSLTALQPEFSFFSKSHFIIWLYLLALHFILKLPGNSTPRKIIFNAAFTLSCWWLLQYTGLVMLLWFILSLLLLRPFSLKEWVVGLLGWITPVYFYVGVLVISGRLILIKQWPNYSLNLPVHLPDPILRYTLVGSLVFLALLSIFQISRKLIRIPVEIRRKWMVVHLSLVIVFLTTLFADNTLKAAWQLPLAPLSLMIALNLGEGEGKGISNFVFYLILTLVIFAQNYNRLSAIFT